MAVAEAFTLRGAETALTGLLCEAAGASTVVDFLERAGRARIDTATFAPLVVRAAEAGDSVARGILSRAGETLGATAGHVIRRLRMEEIAFDLVMAGGVIRSDSPFLLGPLEASARSVAPLVAPVRLDTPAVVGAVLLAMDLTEGATEPDLRAGLAEGVVSKLGPLGD